MREFPKGGLVGKSVRLWRSVASLKVPLYAANASFFIVMAVFPALLLLLGILQHTPLEVERLGEMLSGLLPEAFTEGAEELILTTYDSLSGTVLGLSAATTLWSAGRGMYGVLTGLNAIYGVEENRGYLRTRLISMAYTLAFLLVLLLTLMLHVFGTGLLGFLKQVTHPFVRFLLAYIDFRFFLLLFLQTMIFSVMFMVLPNGTYRFRDSVPGALLASCGWLLFSNLFSWYVERFGGIANVYGSVYGLALGMLWLYCCMSIVFYGGVLNVLLRKWR